MPWKLPSGKIILSPKRVTIGDTQYSRGIFTKWSTENLAAIGIHQFDEIKYDESFYTSLGYTDTLGNDGVVTRSHDITPKFTLPQIKKHIRAKAKGAIRNLWLDAKFTKDYLDDMEGGAGSLELEIFITTLKEAAVSIKSDIDSITAYADAVDYLTSASGIAQRYPTMPEL